MKSADWARMAAAVLGLAAAGFGVSTAYAGASLIGLLAFAGVDRSLIGVARWLPYAIPAASLAGAVLVPRRPKTAVLFFAISLLAGIGLGIPFSAPINATNRVSLALNLLAALFALAGRRKPAVEPA
jgi:hypothetical protein